MPPKAKITKDMIVDAAFELVREMGEEGLRARTIAKRLHCSTQPVMYYFAGMEELKRAVYAKLDRYHSEYLMHIADPRKGLIREIGLNYIRFAMEEPRLFRFLFQSGLVLENSLPEMIDSSLLLPVLSALQEALGMDMERTKEVFMTLALFVHGYASLVANNSFSYEEEETAAQLERVYRGAVSAAVSQALPEICGRK